MDWESSLRDLLKEQRPELSRELSASGQLKGFLQAQVARVRELEKQLQGFDPSLVQRLVEERLPDFLPDEEE